MPEHRGVMTFCEAREGKLSSFLSLSNVLSSIITILEVPARSITAVPVPMVIFVHNHPSGDTEVSEDDIELTKRLAKAGEIVGIDVLDHIIIGAKNYLSLKRHDN